MRWSALNPWKDLAGLPRESWLIALATLVNRAGTMVMPFLVLFLTRDRGLAPTRAGLAIALYGVVALLWSPITGRLGDAWGQLRMVKASLFSSAAVLLAIPLFHSYASILVGMVLLALVSEPVRPATMALVSHLAPPHRRRQAFALNRLAVNLGMSIGPTVGGFLAESSFRSLFWVDAATSLLAGLVLVVVPFRAPRHFHDPAAVRPGSALADRKLLYALAALLPVLLVFFQHVSTMALFLVDTLGFRPSVYGSLFAINTLVIVLSEVRLNTLTGHWPFARSMAVGAFLSTLGFAALALARSLPAVVGTVLLWTLGEMILFPTTSAYISEISPPSRRGEYLGFYTMTFGLAFSLGPWLGTLVLERWGGVPLWALCLPVGGLSVLALARVSGHGTVPVRPTVPSAN
ncbi:MAG: MDR family MFS transporter [Myxococcaceae bacterium]